VRRFVQVTLASLVVAPFLTLASSSVASAQRLSCAAITKPLVVSQGFTRATGPVVTPYNYAKPSKNAQNALGTTIDFGAKALVVGCVSPADIAKLSVLAQGSMKPVMTAQQYMNYMVKQAAPAMKKTPVAGTNDYLDFGNGKEDGVGSTVSMGSVRLDAWVAGGYIFLGFSGPVTSANASPALVKFIKWTERTY